MVISPCSIPKVSSSTLAIGARQLVVQEALEMILCSGFRSSSLTPRTMVASISSLAGTVRRTCLAPASRCLLQRFAGPEDAGGLDDEVDAQLLPGQTGRVPLLEHLDGVPTGAHHPVTDDDFPGKRPKTVSYFSKWASVSSSVRSLTATISIPESGCSAMIRYTARPIRPKPLMATFIETPPGVFGWKLVGGRLGPPGEQWYPLRLPAPIRLDDAAGRSRILKVRRVEPQAEPARCRCECMTPGKILLIEDEPSNSRLMEVSLRPLGYETLVKADGSSGLQAAHDETIELIVLDIALPELDGWQVLDRLRSDPHTMAIPVLVLTAHVGDENLMKAADGGADVFMTKPFQPDDLRQVVRALIEQRRETLAQRNGNPTS